jgi:hypothetical protein
MAPAARPVLRKLRRVIELTLTSVWLKRVGEPDHWMLARTPSQSGRIHFFAMDRTFIDRLASESDHRRAKEIAQAALDGRTTVLEAVRALVSLAHTDAVADVEDRKSSLELKAKPIIYPLERFANSGLHPR